VAVLAGGTAFAQALSILVLPVLTRIYSPHDFEILAMYVAIISIFSTVACLRFEIAIPMPEDDGLAINLVILSLLSAVSLVLLFFTVILLLSNHINQWTDYKLAGYLWLLPIGTLLSAFYSAFQFWAIRKRKFTVVAKTRITQAVSGASVQVGMGLVGAAPVGLLFGQLLQGGAGAVLLGKKFVNDASDQLTSISRTSLKNTFKRFERFPKYSTWEALTNSAGIQLPVIMIASYTQGAEAGYIMLAMKLLSAPMSLVGGSIAQVYLSEASEQFQDGTLRKFTLNTMWSLLKIGFFPVLLVALVSPTLIPVVFGDDWVKAGVLISWMAPWFLMQFIVSPVSMALHIIGAQKAAMFLQVFGLFLRAGLVLWACNFCNEFVGEVYAVSGFLFYVIYLMVVERIVK